MIKYSIIVPNQFSLCDNRVEQYNIVVNKTTKERY